MAEFTQPPLNKGGSVFPYAPALNEEVSLITGHIRDPLFNRASGDWITMFFEKVSCVLAIREVSFVLFGFQIWFLSLTSLRERKTARLCMCVYVINHKKWERGRSSHWTGELEAN